MKNYKTAPKGWTRTTFAEIDAALETIGAKTSTAQKAAQPTASGYLAEAFAEHGKPVFDYQIVDSKGLSFANANSELYRMADGETHPLIKEYAFGGYYVETSKAIYIN